MLRRSPLITLVMASICLSLSACAIKPHAILPIPKNPKKAYLKHIKLMALFHAWTAQGAISIQLKNKAQSAHFTWKQARNQNYNIELYGPLGLGAIHLVRQKNRITLTNNHHKTTAPNAEILMQEKLGWSIPVEGLADWIKGIPVAHIPERHRLNQYGLLNVLHQEGWTIRYSQYLPLGGTALPKVIQLTRADLRIKLVLNQMRIQSIRH